MTGKQHLHRIRQARAAQRAADERFEQAVLAAYEDIWDQSGERRQRGKLSAEEIAEAAEWSRMRLYQFLRRQRGEAA